MIRCGNPKAKFSQVMPGLPPEEGCWDWTGGKDAKGYGSFRSEGKLHKAHRVSYEIFVGPIPPGLSILHSCDRPVCVQPSHLRPGDAKDNASDASKRNRLKVVIPPELVPLIRERYRNGESCRSIARDLGVSHPTISKTVRGVSRRYSEGPTEEGSLVQRGERHHQSKMSDEEKDEVRSLYPQLTQRELSVRFGVSQSTINRIINS